MKEERLRSALYTAFQTSSKKRNACSKQEYMILGSWKNDGKESISRTRDSFEQNKTAIILLMLPLLSDPYKSDSFHKQSCVDA